MTFTLGSRLRLTLVGIVIIVVVLLAWVVAAYNSVIAKDQMVGAQWAQVENQYQRKIDLLPRLVNVTAQYQQFERSTLENITRPRSQWMNASGIDQRVNLTNTLDQNLFAIRVTYENYPELHSDQLVAGLMDEIAGTESRIAVERARYNDSVRTYNTAILSFPTNLVAGAFGFQQRHYYDPIPGGP